ncbi:TPA: AlpA family phage regulatory protein [Escherichia coli]|nr:AlpA family phage regulatory protein [Escherichia coli]
MNDINNSQILLRDDVMKKLRYSNAAAFHMFFNRTPDFPKPLKIGRRNAWYEEDVQNWLDEQRRKALEE